MLKKAGIVVAATAAGLLAVSPLAFAGQGGGDGGHGHGHGHGHGGDRTHVFQIDDDRNFQANSADDNRSQSGLVNVGDVNALQNVCAAVPVNAAVIANVLGLLGTPTSAAAGSGVSQDCTSSEDTNLVNSNR